MADHRKKRRRAKGTGTVYERNGTYYLEYREPATGKKHKKSLRTKNKAEALRKAEQMERAMDARTVEEVTLHVARARNIIHSRDLPFAEVWDEFMATNPTAGAGTLGLYKRALDEFSNWMAAERPSVTSFAQVDLETAIAYMEGVWQSGVSASTYNDKRNALGHIAKKLANKFGIESNPWPRTERKKGVKQTRLPLTREQVGDLVERLDDPKGLAYPDEVRALTYLCLFAGMRLIDATQLKWAEVDLAAGAIRYTPAKTARTSGVVAQVPILTPLHNCLSALPRDEEHVLPKVAAHYDRNPDYIKLHLLGLIHKVTGEGRQEAKGQHQRARSQYGVHSLRHTFATEAARAGAPPAYLSLMTGDTLQTLQRFYVKVGYAQQPVPGFESIPHMIEGKQQAEPTEPERAQLRQLADALPIEAVRQILASIGKGLPVGSK